MTRPAILILLTVFFMMGCRVEQGGDDTPKIVGIDIIDFGVYGVRLTGEQASAVNTAYGSIKAAEEDEGRTGHAKEDCDALQGFRVHDDPFFTYE